MNILVSLLNVRTGKTNNRLNRKYQFNMSTFEPVYRLNLQNMEPWKDISTNWTISNVHLPLTKEFHEWMLINEGEKTPTSIEHVNECSKLTGRHNPSFSLVPNFASQTNAPKMLITYWLTYGRLGRKHKGLKNQQATISHLDVRQINRANTTTGNRSKIHTAHMPESNSDPTNARARTA